jgi:predicted O-methyltransferase YrrM
MHDGVDQIKYLFGVVDRFTVDIINITTCHGRHYQPCFNPHGSFIDITMKSSLHDPQVTEVLDALYAEAAKSDALRRSTIQGSDAAGKTEADFYKAARKSYMAVGRDFGNLLYSLARSTKAKTVVEFGTSFGISTIFLASAIRDNGSGKVITTEFEPEKAAQAKRNLAAAGLEQWVEFRVGDALETLSDPPREIDMIFLDGAKTLYFGVLKLLEPQLRSGGIVASDNTDHGWHGCVSGLHARLS